MVLLVEKLFHSHKPSSKLENHHHHHRGRSEPLSASLQAFQCYVSTCINKLSLNSKPGSESMSLSWIHECLELLSNLNRAFAKLVMEMEYPMSKWDDNSSEQYLSYSLKLLDLLNVIASSLSHLGLARMSISHALSLISEAPESAMERLKAVELIKNLDKEIKVEAMEGGEEKRLSYGEKKWVFDKALMVMKRNGYWLCGIVLLGLSGDTRLCLEMQNLGSGFLGPSAMAVMEKNGVAKEVSEVNDDMAYLVAAIAAGENYGDAGKKLEGKLEVMEKLLDGIGTRADGLFSEIMAGRIELLDGLRQMKP
ncbi:hypothetical protein Vadar_034725 [Vaccinium darrowii]|uniref:Uncharacterized protein n=1 Tax=Vaccinium darrowii TaxID=229202 RepID=A0ACB7ZH28_9ERIC|nr:hypothetical protein Vadar_034725 [Vaccinium darrowii]